MKRENEDSMKKYKLASFFSGIGGFELGFETAGFETVFQCEINPFCREVLEKHWPNVSKFNDIQEVQIENIPFSDVWAGGFPCQDLSLARMGKREGLRGKKSKLYYEFAELVGKAHPKVVVIENVSGLLSSHQGQDFEIVIRTLSELGYAVGWRTFNSKHFGVPQSRHRVYIVGCYQDWQGPGKILFEPECSEGDNKEGRSNEATVISPFKKIIGNPSGKGPVVQSIAYCLYATSARHTGTDWSRTYVSYPRKGQVRRLTPSECEGVMGFPPRWTELENKKSYSVDDLDTLRYQALGNAVTPPVIMWIAKQTRMYLENVKEGGESNFFNTKLNSA
jgi:DNA (cytosine-5)-methyltransferase 1